MIEELKIAIKTLSATASFIRKEEDKYKGNMRFANRFGYFRGDSYFRHKKDEPQPQPKVYKNYEPDTALFDESYAKYWNLHQSRTNKIRKEARITYLAYAFLRGIPYSVIENKTHDSLDSFQDQSEVKEKRILDSVKARAKIYSNMSPQEFAQKWAEWFDGVKDHIQAQKAL